MFLSIPVRGVRAPEARRNQRTSLPEGVGVPAGEVAARRRRQDTQLRLSALRDRDEDVHREEVRRDGNLHALG